MKNQSLQVFKGEYYSVLLLSLLPISFVQKKVCSKVCPNVIVN